ncbi:hypothetical protein EO087_00285 [Dyella sp. M7H15-1]|uniref:phage late control D family protein n=1 Tax=Dyella sp. M7H15-1 TaxID=2501295 RepID=UPI0010051DC4|nr:contractile injection system protein, VgrG/Pvc8 family [Dyella sp. M7H15-1]QAU22603.1 hypothetical protein EO087_00285 [Dyella sp. M7H15-1]
MSNHPSLANGTVRAPRGIVRVNGQQIAGWAEWEVESHTYRESSTFRVLLVLSALAAPNDEAWFCSQTTMTVEVYGGFPTDPSHYGVSDLDRVLVGNVDDMHYDPVQRTLELTGRDLTSLLIDAKTTETFCNQTASQIATTLAQRHGLTPVVTVTSDMAGRYYQIDHIQLTDAHTEWDLLTWLAAQVGYVVYVKAHELHFEPAPNPSTAPVYPIMWTPADTTQTFQATVEQLSFSRTLTVGKTMTVTVRSWNPKQRHGFSQTYPTGRTKGIRPGTATAPAQQYFLTIPNLMPDQAVKRAQAKYNELIRQEMRMSVVMPGYSALTIAHVIQVTGTGTVFDQNYFPESIVRRMGIDESYFMSVSARNHSNDVQVAE